MQKTRIVIFTCLAVILSCSSLLTACSPAQSNAPIPEEDYGGGGGMIGGVGGGRGVGGGVGGSGR